ncbi:hypothetical protein EJ110_NYTH56841 [Nymphaea thermarum]|nr:hypothetical protein EJ110_NYTH56841 [Nymphaea thermarum]
MKTSQSKKWMSWVYPLCSNTYPVSDQDNHNMCIEVFHVHQDLGLFLYHGKSIIHFFLLQMRQGQKALVFTLFRNLLAVQGLSPLQKASGTSTQFLYLAERFLEILFSEHVMELIVVVTQHLSGSDAYLCQDNLLLLDIFHYIFLGQKPELVACPAQEELMGNVNAAASLSSLRSMLEEEDEKRRVMRLQHLESLHFAGTFARYNVDGSKTLLKGKPSVVHADSLLKNHKVHRGPLKRIVWENESLIPPNRRMLELLHGFAEQFLSGGYNVLMQSIRNDIQKDHHTVQNGDVMHFFQVARFFTAYQFYRYPVPKVDAGAPEASSMDQGTNDGLFHGAVCGPIAETMNEAMFTLVLSKWHYAFDSLKETHDYKFLSSSGSLMKEMMRQDALDTLTTSGAMLGRSPLRTSTSIDVSKKSRKRSKKRLGSVQEKQAKEVGEDVQIDAVGEMKGDAMHSALKPLVDLENAGKGVSTKDGNCDYGPECGNESSENDEQAGVVEVDLDVTHIMSMFANGKIVQNLCWLLRFYKSNHTNTNHYIISMLQRISDDLELSPMLFQTNRDCHYINSEFLLHEIGSLRSKARKWLDSSTGVQGGEANKTRPPINIADALGDDEADLLPSYKLDNNDEHEKSSQSGSEDGNGEVGLLNIRTSLSAEGRGMDKDLSLLFKTQKRCSHLIANALDSNKKYSAAQVSRKLKQLGLQRPHLDIVENNRESNEIDADLATTERNESDDETLSAYKERLKTDTNMCLEHEQTTMTNPQRTEVQDDASDDEPLGVIFKRTVVENEKQKASVT